MPQSIRVNLVCRGALVLLFWLWYAQTLLLNSEVGTCCYCPHTLGYYAKYVRPLFQFKMAIWREQTVWNTFCIIIQCFKLKLILFVLKEPKKSCNGPKTLAVSLGLECMFSSADLEIRNDPFLYRSIPKHGNFLVGQSLWVGVICHSY